MIQFPANSQSLNPYSYIMNNPLSGTDPTGYSTCTEPTNTECNPPEEEAKPRDKTGSTTDKCNRGAACTVITFNGGDSRMSSGDGNEGNKSPDQIGATGNRDNNEMPGEMEDSPPTTGCMVPLKCAGGETSTKAETGAHAGLLSDVLRFNGLKDADSGPKKFVFEDADPTTEKFDFECGVNLNCGFPPLAGAGRTIALAGQLFRRVLGRGYPTKLNRSGTPQPFNPTDGRFLSPDVNPGLLLSPLGRFTSGFSQGFAEGLTGVQNGTVVGAAGSIGNTLGKIFGTFTSLFSN